MAIMLQIRRFFIKEKDHASKDSHEDERYTYSLRNEYVRIDLEFLSLFTKTTISLLLPRVPVPNYNAKYQFNLHLEMLNLIHKSRELCISL